MSNFMMIHWAYSALIIWSFFVHFGAPLSLSRQQNPHSADWVEGIIGENRPWWTSIATKCRDFAPKGRVFNTFGPNEEENINITTLGPRDEFWDFKPAEMDKIQDEYTSWCGPECEFAPRAFMPINKTSYQTYVGPGWVQHLPFTTGKCMNASGSEGTVTCHFKNLYAIKGTLEAHYLEGDDFPSGDLQIVVRSGLGPPKILHKIKIYSHKNSSMFRRWMDDTYAPGNFTHFDGNTVAYTPVWHFNIGHALYDGLYPAFVALLQWGMHKNPFRVFLLGEKDPPNVEKMVPGAFKRNSDLIGDIGGKGTIRQFNLADDPEKYFSIFDHLIIGMGYNGQKLDLNGNFSLGGGRDLGATRHFRNHVYHSMKIDEVTWDKNANLKGIIIENKRWGNRPKWADNVIAKAAKRNVYLQYIEWGKVGNNDVKNPSPSTKTFRDQMLVMSYTYIHISSPGTAMMYQHFLPDGAVHINLGEDPNLPRLFMEEHMAEGCPYIRALYYWPGKGLGNYNEDRIVDLVMKAKELILGNFTIPVPINTNLSPVLKVLKVFEYLTAADPAQVKGLTPLRSMPSQTPSFATDYLLNHYAHEFVKPFHGHQFNPCLTKALTDDYGLPCQDYKSTAYRQDCASWGFP